MAKQKRLKRTVLKNKPRKYKIGDTVEVDFNGERHSAKNNDLNQPEGWAGRWAYKVRLKDGYKVPFVGIKNTEKFCNIVA